MSESLELKKVSPGWESLEAGNGIEFGIIKLMTPIVRYNMIDISKKDF